MESIPSKPLRNMASTSRTTQPPTNAGQHANTGSDLNVDQLVLERALAANRGHANKTAEDIKQEELLRRAAESKPTPPRPRQQVATTRKKAPAVTTSHATVEEDQRQKDEAALMQIVAQRSASANKEEADLTARIIESKTAAIATEAKGNPDDYVSEKGDAIDLLAIAARRSVDGTVTSQDNVPSGTAGDAPNPPNDIEYDNETGRPLVKDRMPAGSVAPGAYSGAPGAEYQALEPVRLDVLGSSDMSPAQGQAEPSTVDTSGMPTTGGATLVRSGGESDDPAETAVKDNADSKKNPMMIGAVVVFLFLVIVLAIAIPLAVRGGGTDGPEAQSTNEEGEVDLFLPTRAPDTDMEAYLLSLVPEETAEVIAVSQQLEVSGNKTAAPASLSPPVEAFRWMLEHQSLIEYSDARLLQRFSLATLYYTTEGQAWTRGGQWLSFDQHECSWDERVIECEGMWEEDNYFGGVVTAIKLLRNRLEGSIPNELSLLSNVGVVDLSGNELKGSMPYTIGNMNNLTSLVLDDNQLSGQIPSEMGLLTSLRRFSAQDNSLNGTLAPELGDMIDLSDLVLSRNQISESIMEKHTFVFWAAESP
ncbi:Leucine Rich Repeat [Seminavis robusta]|uniref:Leucine Rich Repeat n=1 Tax=Seminavis robusta TaxID=568900 RepID=A0A9N8EDF5_9STRA|nr:Leucine Rich Repeat [Seminavis robusta]|eukprot:Sro1014_g231460.1 Leucine Rich Repeat (591) ;mRNA; r:29688-31591